MRCSAPDIRQTFDLSGAPIPIIHHYLVATGNAMLIAAAIERASSGNDGEVVK
jgi:hypothetical protein